MKDLIIFALIPLIFSVGISTYLPTADAQLLPQIVTDDPKYFEANGMGLAILEYNGWPTTPYDYLMKNLPVLTPLAQLNSGILPFDVQCKENLELMVKPSKSAACVNANSVMKLLEINWIHVFEPAVALAAAGVESEGEESDLATEESISETIQRQSFPSDDQRAMSYVVTFSGASLLLEEMEPIYTISKYKHLSKYSDETKILPEQDTETPQFLLEALPSLDKKTYYRMIMDWLYDKPEARAFDTKIDLVAGNGQTIQSMVYTDCRVASYYTYLLENLVVFSFHQKFEPEIREKAFFECAGFEIEVPEHVE